MNYEHDPKTVNMMADLLSGLNDIESGEEVTINGVPHRPGGDVGAMHDILSSLNEAGMAYGEPLPSVQQPVQQMTSYNSPYQTTPQQAPVVQRQVKPKTNWSLVEEVVTGTKSTKVYN